MVKIELLLKEGKIGRIPELEQERYHNFFSASFADNLSHAKAVRESFPRWSIISGYYAMHDSAKLLIARQYRLKVEYEVHATTITLLRELLKDKASIALLEDGYQEFIAMANDLAQAKKERVKTQYYTGSAFMHSEYQKRSAQFLEKTVEPFIAKIKRLLR